MRGRERSFRVSANHASARIDDAAPKTTQRRSPATEEDAQRHRERGSRRGTEGDPARVDAGREPGPIGEPFLDDDRQHRARQTHADADRERQEDERRRTGRRCADEAEDADQRNRREHAEARADPSGQMPGGEREEPHAEHRDRREQPGDGVRDAEVVLDLRQQRPDPDELRPEHERGKEERREEGPASHRGGRISRACRRLAGTRASECGSSRLFHTPAVAGLMRG